MKLKLLIRENQDRINMTTLPFTMELVNQSQRAKQNLFSIKGEPEEFKVVLFMEKILHKEFGNIKELRKDKETYRSVLFHVVMNVLDLLMNVRKTPKDAIDFLENSIRNIKEDVVLRQSKTAPLEKFSVTEFIEEFKEGITIDEAEELFEQLGRGEFRTAFRMPQGFVLKVENSPDGIKINREEILELEVLHRETNKKSQDPNVRKLFVKPIARAEDFSWTMFEKIKIPEFHSEAFKQRYSDVVQFVEEKTGDRVTNFRDALESFDRGILSGEIDIDELASVVQNHPELDFIWHHQEEQWTKDLHGGNVGLREDGSVVIFDIGHDL